MDQTNRLPKPPGMLCARCREFLYLPQNAEGKRVRCPKCGHKQPVSDKDQRN
jgi:LSD1 subclass zinc finger protein